MNEVTRLVADTLKVSLEEAVIWQDRIEDWDDLDWSETSYATARKHIKAFVSDWEKIYSRVKVS
jgi:hypothetical protein